jgi:hypothetical protein
MQWLGSGLAKEGHELLGQGLEEAVRGELLSDPTEITQL